MRHVLLTLVLALGAAVPLGAAEPGRKLNVLMIVVDDLNNDLGCYGHSLVKSPNFDRLAARGVRFDRAYCQYAVCAPSRWSFLSGLRPETTRIFDFQTLLRTRIPDVVFLPQLFRQNGYFTAGNGKVFHDMRQSDAAISWDAYQDKMGDDPQEAAAVKRRYSFPEGKRPFEWTRLDDAGDKTRDGITARTIAKFMEDKSKEGKPFFVAAGFHKPHLPWTAPAKYFDLYPPNSVPRPNEPPLQNIPAIALMTELTGNPPPSSRTEAMAAYYACISYTDAQIGILLDTLDRLQLWEDTVVVLFSDHGYHLGDHNGLWAKWTVFEQAARVPLIIAAPGYGKGKTSARIVELIDIYPTLADLCALQKPARLDGKSLAPLLKQSDAAWDRPAYILVHHNDVEGKSVRTERWRYTEWDGGKKGAELYDHDRDPNEYDSLAQDPKHANTIADLKQLLGRAKPPEPIVVPAQKHPGDNAECVAFSRDGKYVAAAFGGPSNGRFPLKPNGGGIAVWEADTGRQLQFLGEYGDVIKMEFSPDGKSLAYSRVYTPGDSVDDDVVVVLNIETGKVVKRWSDYRTGHQFLMSRSADDILVGPDVYDLKGFIKTKTLLETTPRCLAASADGKRLAMVHPVKEPIIRSGVESKKVSSLVMKGLTVFDTLKFEKLRGIETTDLKSCFAIALGRDGKKLVTGHNAGIARIWDGDSLTEVSTIETGFRGHVLPLFSPDGTTLALATQQTNGLHWQYKSAPSGFKIERDKPGSGCEVIFLETTGWHETGRWQFQDGAYRTHYFRSGKSDLYPEYNPDRFVFSPNGKQLLAGCNGVVLLEAATGKLVRQFEVQQAGP